jgi:hypothetical protein
LLGKADVLFAAVDAVPGEGEAEVLKVDSDLVGPPSVKENLDQGCVAEPFEDAVAGARFAPFSWLGNGHGAAARGMTADRSTDFAAWRGQIAAEDSVIDFFHGALAELIGKAEMRGIILRDDHATAGIFIETMDNPGTRIAGDAAQLPFAVMEQRINEGMLVVSRAGVHDEVRLFVDHEQIGIFIKDFERNLFGEQIELLRFRPVDSDDIARFGRVGGFNLPVVDLDIAGINEFLQGAAGRIRKERAEIRVETLAGLGGFDREGFGPFGHRQAGASLGV